mmetsp:Transcript_16701/g.31972  ORF Transcript_16701/g.31972 Transcript_16701/m.31972 type:complete len:213 (-) Transcript_16701:656-1294(-)
MSRWLAVSRLPTVVPETTMGRLPIVLRPIPGATFLASRIARWPAVGFTRIKVLAVVAEPTTPGDREAEAAVVGVGGVSGTLDLSTHLFAKSRIISSATAFVRPRFGCVCTKCPCSRSPPRSCSRARSSTATNASTSSSSLQPSCFTFLLRSRTQLRISMGLWFMVMDVLVAVHPIKSIPPWACKMRRTSARAAGVRRQSVDKTILASVCSTT